MTTEQEAAASVDYRCGICGDKITGPLNDDTARRIGQHQASHTQWGDRAGE